MLHRAILGSFERFIGILIEHYEGAFPIWLAPEQAVIVNITDAQGEYAKEMTQSLQDKGFRVTSDLRNEKIGFKIREHSISRVPYLLIVGEKEKESRTLAIRSREGEDLGNMSLAQVIELLSEGIARLGRNVAKTE
jgi:threonyl-tRNA synthetase